MRFFRSRKYPEDLNLMLNAMNDNSARALLCIEASIISFSTLMKVGASKRESGAKDFHPSTSIPAPLTRYSAHEEKGVETLNLSDNASSK